MMMLKVLVSAIAMVAILPRTATSIQPMRNFSSLSKTILDEGDVLDVPEWLQEGAKENQIEKYRVRRFLTFPSSSTLTVTLEFSIPVSGLGDTNTLTIKDAIVYNLPTTGYNIFGRSIAENTHERIDVYNKFEEFISGFGFDGHACTLRAICELAELPFEHGMVGEVINMVFSLAAGPSHLSSNSVYDDYSTAEYYGKHYGNCAEYYPKCSSSVLDFVSKTSDS